MAYKSNSAEEELKHSFGSVVETAGTVASQVGKDVRSGAVEIGTAVLDASQQAAKELGKKGEYAAKVVSDQAHVVADKLDETVRRAPLLSLAAAAGLGAVVAMLCSRRS
jgi:ElaB/YqjD/DUF883 family membrane-anchored ribosome-binding protein